MVLPRPYAVQLLLVAAILLCLPPFVLSSLGDKSIPFQNYLRKCLIANCSSQDKLMHFEEVQPHYMQLLGWNCKEECKYHSMWNTVHHFIKHKLEVPQFYGKWPFIRILGIQEPASVIFSVLNGLANIYMIWRMRQRIPKKAPMCNIWQGYAMIASVAWVFSTIFHARDVGWTEYLDYFAAFALTITGLWTACIRIFAYQRDSMNVKIAVPITLVLLCIYVRHVYYLAKIHFDYGYNMKVNVIVGICMSLLWVSWSLYRIKRQPYLWKTIATVIIGNLLVLLELMDFPPLLWTFDAHSLWHAGTSPMPLLFFSFCIDDSLYLLQYSEGFKKGV
ncbi:post-GPI attachment to proteins factor 3-like isoform X2 [Amphiura filiformis]